MSVSGGQCRCQFSLSGSVLIERGLEARARSTGVMETSHIVLPFYKLGLFCVIINVL